MDSHEGRQAMLDLVARSFRSKSSAWNNARIEYDGIVEEPYYKLMSRSMDPAPLKYVLAGVAKYVDKRIKGGAYSLIQDSFIFDYDVRCNIDGPARYGEECINISVPVKWACNPVEVRYVPGPLRDVLVSPELTQVIHESKARSLNEFAGMVGLGVDEVRNSEAHRAGELVKVFATGTYGQSKIARLVKGCMLYLDFKEKGPRTYESFSLKGMEYRVKDLVKTLDYEDTAYVFNSNDGSNTASAILYSMCQEYPHPVFGGVAHVTIPADASSILLVAYSYPKTKFQVMITAETIWGALVQYADQFRLGGDLEAALAIACSLRQNKYFTTVTLPGVISTCDIIYPAMTRMKDGVTMKTLISGDAAAMLGRVHQMVSLVLFKDLDTSMTNTAILNQTIDSSLRQLFKKDDRGLVEYMGDKCCSEILKVTKSMNWMSGMDDASIAKMRSYSVFEGFWLVSNPKTVFKDGIMKCLKKGYYNQVGVMKPGLYMDTFRTLSKEVALATGTEMGDMPVGGYNVRLACIKAMKFKNKAINLTKDGILKDCFEYSSSGGLKKLVFSGAGELSCPPKLNRYRDGPFYGHESESDIEAFDSGSEDETDDEGEETDPEEDDVGFSVDVVKKKKDDSEDDDDIAGYGSRSGGPKLLEGAVSKSPNVSRGRGAVTSSRQETEAEAPARQSRRSIFNNPPIEQVFTANPLYLSDIGKGNVEVQVRTMPPFAGSRVDASAQDKSDSSTVSEPCENVFTEKPPISEETVAPDVGLVVFNEISNNSSARRSSESGKPFYERFKGWIKEVLSVEVVPTTVRIEEIYEDVVGGKIGYEDVLTAVSKLEKVEASASADREVAVDEVGAAEGEVAPKDPDPDQGKADCGDRPVVEEKGKSSSMPTPVKDSWAFEEGELPPQPIKCVPSHVERAQSEKFVVNKRVPDAPLPPPPKTDMRKEWTNMSHYSLSQLEKWPYIKFVEGKYRYSKCAQVWKNVLRCLPKARYSGVTVKEFRLGRKQELLDHVMWSTVLNEIHDVEFPEAYADVVAAVKEKMAVQAIEINEESEVGDLCQIQNQRLRDAVAERYEWDVDNKEDMLSLIGVHCFFVCIPRWREVAYEWFDLRDDSTAVIMLKDYKWFARYLDNNGSAKDWSTIWKMAKNSKILEKMEWEKVSTKASDIKKMWNKEKNNMSAKWDLSVAYRRLCASDSYSFDGKYLNKDDYNDTVGTVISMTVAKQALMLWQLWETEECITHPQAYVIAYKNLNYKGSRIYHSKMRMLLSDFMMIEDDLQN